MSHNSNPYLKVSLLVILEWLHNLALVLPSLTVIKGHIYKEVLGRWQKEAILPF